MKKVVANTFANSFFLLSPIEYGVIVKAMKHVWVKCDMGMRVDGAGRVREKTQTKYNTHSVIQLSFILLMNGFLEWIHIVVRKEFFFT